jgi:hypothetical protein
MSITAAAATPMPEIPLVVDLCGVPPHTIAEVVGPWQRRRITKGAIVRRPWQEPAFFIRSCRVLARTSELHRRYLSDRFLNVGFGGALVGQAQTRHARECVAHLGRMLARDVLRPDSLA